MQRRSRPIEVLTLAAPPLALASGEWIAERYRVVEHYGSGPLGHTYRAFTESGDAVALKLVAHALVPTAGERAKLVVELEKVLGRALPGVELPMAAGLAGEHVWVASRWIEGRSLRRILGAWREAGEHMPHGQVRAVLEGVSRSLRNLHQAAAHGALYPESVQIARDGRVVLTDALLGVYVSRARYVDHLASYTELWPYLSPELRAGRSSSAGSDLYALGALASEMLTGDAGLARAGLTGPVLRGLSENVVRALESLVSSHPARRSAALPALLDGLDRAIAVKQMPQPEALPERTSPTMVLPTAPALVPAPRKPR